MSIRHLLAPWSYNQGVGRVHDVALLLLGCVACGRIGFEPSTAGGDGGNRGDPDAQTFDPNAWPPVTPAASVYLGTGTIRPHVTWNGDAFAVVWDGFMTPDALYATYAADGTPIEAPRPIALGLVEWTLTTPNGVLLLHVRGSSDLRLAHVDRSGAITSDVAIATGHSADVAYNLAASRLCISWIDESTATRHPRAVTTDLLGNKLGPVLVVASGVSDYVTAVGCDGDVTRVMWAAGTTTAPHYRIYVGDSPATPETRIATVIAGSAQLQGAKLGTPGLSDAHVLYRMVAGSDISFRIGRIALDGTGVLGGDQLVADSQRAIMRWADEGRFLVAFERFGQPGWLPYLVTLSPAGDLIGEPVLLGTDVAPLGDSMPTSVARSPGGSIAIGIERFDSGTFEMDSYVAFLVPQ